MARASRPLARYISAYALVYLYPRRDAHMYA